MVKIALTHVTFFLQVSAQLKLENTIINILYIKKLLVLFKSKEVRKIKTPNFIKKYQLKIVAMVLFVTISSVFIILQTVHGKNAIIIDISEYGLYNFDEIYSTISDDKLITRHRTEVERITLINQTNIISMVIGNKFGFRYFINGSQNSLKNIEIKFVIVFPKIGINIPDKNQISFKNEISFIQFNGESYFLGYMLENVWELVPGKWILQLWHNDEKLAQQIFYLEDLK